MEKLLKFHELVINFFKKYEENEELDIIRNSTNI